MRFSEKKVSEKKIICHRICSFSKKKSGRLEQYRERYREIIRVGHIHHPYQLKPHGPSVARTASHPLRKDGVGLKGWLLTPKKVYSINPIFFRKMHLIFEIFKKNFF